jgi:hypothetical protein
LYAVTGVARERCTILLETSRKPYLLQSVCIKGFPMDAGVFEQGTGNRWQSVRVCLLGMHATEPARVLRKLSSLTGIFLDIVNKVRSWMSIQKLTDDPNEHRRSISEQAVEDYSVQDENSGLCVRLICWMDRVSHDAQIIHHLEEVSGAACANGWSQRFPSGKHSHTIYRFKQRLPPSLLESLTRFT